MTTYTAQFRKAQHGPNDEVLVLLKDGEEKHFVTPPKNAYGIRKTRPDAATQKLIDAENKSRVAQFNALIKNWEKDGTPPVEVTQNTISVTYETLS